MARPAVVDDRLDDDGAVEHVRASGRAPREPTPRSKSERVMARADEAIGISPFDGRAVFAGQDHAGNRQAAHLGHRRQLETSEDRQHARIQRVAAQFVSRESRAIDQRDARPRAREHGSGNRAGRSGAGDNDVIHRDRRNARQGVRTDA